MAAADGDKGEGDFYHVLGLNKECTDAELRNAYKKLAMRWHPDRCSASGNLKYVEEAKKKFQAIQHAYSVLSDSNKRFMYDVGFYGGDDDDDENGMLDFLNEMVSMMNQDNGHENGEESFEELQELFDDMFQMEGFGASSQSSSYSSSSSHTSCSNITNSSSAEINLGNMKVEGSSSFDANYGGFCFGTGGGQSGKFAESERERNKRRNHPRRGRK